MNTKVTKNILSLLNILEATQPPKPPLIAPVKSPAASPTIVPIVVKIPAESSWSSSLISRSFIEDKLNNLVSESVITSNLSPFELISEISESF